MTDNDTEALNEENETPRERRKRLRREVFDEHKTVCFHSAEEAIQTLGDEISHIRNRLDVIEEKLAITDTKTEEQQEQNT